MNKFRQAILCAADDVKKLRACDVCRVFESNDHLDASELAAWIVERRPDLQQAVIDATA